MDIKNLQTLVIDALEDVKAQDIVLFDTTHLTSLFDRVAIASGTSNRQTKALAASVRDKVKQNGGHIVGIEGETTGEWVLVDLGDMIVHIMQPAIRAYYRLEEVWGDRAIKLGAAKRVSKRSATEPEPVAAAPKRAARHLTGSAAADAAATGDMAAAKKPATRKPVTRASASKVAMAGPLADAQLAALAAAAAQAAATTATTVSETTEGQQAEGSADAPKPKRPRRAAAKPEGESLEQRLEAAKAEAEGKPPKRAAKPRTAKEGAAVPAKVVRVRASKSATADSKAHAAEKAATKTRLAKAAAKPAAKAAAKPAAKRATKPKAA